ncbi:hypothetical protein CAQU_06425 [Corynebacterium aquilae DSM 44791]|uniref:Prolipoprotein LppL n=1 Tax=Corynebacterium aquilae DSM 44791 TaxID=1431546 RepID=A0A1L7CG16_9CORY|nr:hypothetical protein CAQU_06425 [Corynebacterium aquilae DSM 44791]
MEAADFTLATRVASPPQEQPAGAAVAVDDALKTVDHVVASGKDVAVSNGGYLAIASAAEVEAGKLSPLTLPDGCGAPTASVAKPGTFVLACAEGDAQGEVFLIDANTTQLKPLATVDFPVTTAVQTAAGRVLAAGKTSTTVVALDENSGEEVGRTTVDRPVDQLVAVAASSFTDRATETDEDGTDADGDAVVAINASETVIQGVKVASGKPGAALRIGTGVGATAPGGDNMVLATNTPGNQVFVYTVEPVIRLHQVGNTGEGPWAVTYDAVRKLGWVSTTGDNKITAYRFGSGVPEVVGSLDAPANATSLAVVDGDLVVGADGDRPLTVIKAADVDAAIKDLGRTDMSPTDVT